MKLIIGLCFLLTSFSSYAEQFKSPFLTFNPPIGWNCDHIAGSWNCNSPTSLKNKGIIVITAKTTQIGQSLSSYKARLMNEKTIKWNDKTVISEPQSSEEITIKGQKWIQATHINSEIPNSTTKYVITSKNGLSVLVSFTAHNDDYPTLSASFIKSIESLKLNPAISPKLAPKSGSHPSSGMAGMPGSGGNELDDIFDTDPQNKGGGNFTMSALKKAGAFGLLILGVIIFLISKRRKENL